VIWKDVVSSMDYAVSMEMMIIVVGCVTVQSGTYLPTCQRNPLTPSCTLKKQAVGWGPHNSGIWCWNNWVTAVWHFKTMQWSKILLGYTDP